MKISIITVVYNREATIARAIASVQSQTYQNLEHIIQDGGSNDGTIDIIKRMSNSNTSLQARLDNGIYDAINMGIERATGDVIGLLHSDDFLASTEIISKIACTLKDQNYDGVYGDLQYVSAKNTSRVVRDWKAGAFSKKSLRFGWMPPHPTVYLRRKVFDQLGVYNTDFKISADYDAMLRYLGLGQVQLAYVPEVLVKMQTGGASNQSLRNVFLKTIEDYTALKTNKVGGIGALLVKNVSKVKQFKFGKH